jgi:hypothetical protein
MSGKMAENDAASETVEVESGLTDDLRLATHDWQGGKNLSQSVTEVVSAATGSDVERMRPLFEAIDPEALTGMLESAGSDSERSASVSVQFRYEGCRVTVDGDGQLTAVPLE